MKQERKKQATIGGIEREKELCWSLQRFFSPISKIRFVDEVWLLKPCVRESN
jgi:hypothetical protein